MKFKFKKQQYQTAAVIAVTDCFKGQPVGGGVKYRIDPGRVVEKPLFEGQPVEEIAGFKNEDLRITSPQILENVQAVQRSQNLPISQNSHWRHQNGMRDQPYNRDGDGYRQNILLYQDDV